MTELEQQQDYLERVKRAAPKVDAILKEEYLNLGAQFDPTKWPRNLQPVPIYTDTKDYSVPVTNEVTSPELPEKKTPVEGQPIESPIQREDLEPEEGDEEDDEGINDPL